MAATGRGLVVGDSDQPDRWAVTVMVTLQANRDELVAEVADRTLDRLTEPRERADVAIEHPAYAALVGAVAEHLGGSFAKGEGAGPSHVADLVVDLLVAGASTALVRTTIHGTATVVVDRLVAAGEGEASGTGQARLRPALERVRDAELELLHAFEVVAGEVHDEAGTRTARLREAFLGSVLTGPVRDPLAYARRASSLKLDLTAPIGLVLIVDRGGAAAGTASESFEERVMRCGRRPAELVLPPVFVDPAADEPLTAVLLIPAHRGVEARAAVDALGVGCRELGLLGAHATAPMLADVPVAYHRLRLDAPLLERCARHIGTLTSHDDLLPYRQASEVPASEAEELVRDEVGPLMVAARYAAERVETWKLLVRERLSDADAAERLGVSVSAFGKRKQVIRDLTGDALACGLFRAQLASYVLELWEADLPPPGDPWWGGNEA